MKKRLLSFVLALAMMLSLLSVIGPRTVHAASETYTVNFAMPNEYLEYYQYSQLIHTGIRAKTMNKTQKVITVDGVAYTIFSTTTDAKPDKQTTSFRVCIQNPNESGSVAQSRWECAVDWQDGENIVAVPLDWKTKMTENGSNGTINFVNTANFTATFVLNGGELSNEQKETIAGKGWSYDASGYYTKQFMNSTAYSTIISEWNDCIPSKEGATFDKWVPETGTLTENTTFTANYAGTINVTKYPTQDLKYNENAQTLGYVEADVEGATIQYKVGASEYSADLPKATDAGDYVVGYKVEKTGYKTVEDTFSAHIDKGIPTLTLSSESGSYVIPNAGTFTYVYSGDGAISVSSDDPAKATASVNTTTKTVTVEPVSIGSATITVAAEETNNYSSVSVTYAVTVTPYTVTFDTNDGTPEPEQQVVAYGDKITKPVDPTKEGYTFGGWYKEEACTTAWDFASETVTKDTTLYAKWTEDKATPNASNFTFDAPSSLTYDKTAKEATVIGKEGMGAITVKYATSLDSEEWTTTPPKNAGTYYVKACIAEGTKYVATELTDATWTFTIKPAEDPEVVPNTGDTTNMCLYIMIAILALGTMRSVTVAMHKKANKTTFH